MINFTLRPGEAYIYAEISPLADNDFRQLLTPSALESSALEWGTISESDTDVDMVCRVMADKLCSDARNDSDRRYFVYRVIRRIDGLYVAAYTFLPFPEFGGPNGLRGYYIRPGRVADNQKQEVKQKVFIDIADTGIRESRANLFGELDWSASKE